MSTATEQTRTAPAAKRAEDEQTAPQFMVAVRFCNHWLIWTGENGQQLYGDRDAAVKMRDTVTKLYRGEDKNGKFAARVCEIVP